MNAMNTMSTAVRGVATTGLLDQRRVRWFLIALHVPFVAFLMGQGATGWGITSAPIGAAAVPLALVLGGIQLRHSLAVAAGVRPRFWVGSLIFLALLADLPLFHTPYITSWSTSQWLVLASLAMLLPAGVGAAVAATYLIGFVALYMAVVGAAGIWRTPMDSLFTLAGTITVFGMGAAGLYSGARLVRLLDEVREARTRLAELAIAELLHEQVPSCRTLVLTGLSQPGSSVSRATFCGRSRSTCGASCSRMPPPRSSPTPSGA